MTKFAPLLLAVVACNAAVGPGWDNPPSSKGGLMQIMSALAAGKLGDFMGDPQSTESFIALAKSVGATRDNPGKMVEQNKQMNAGYGLVADPPGAAAKRVILKSKSKAAGAETVKVRYGPYKVPSMKTKNMLGEYGMLSNLPHPSLDSPCPKENCTIVGMKAGLEYADGSNANIDTGLWLHHMVLFNAGPGRVDATCSHRDVSLPHASIGYTPRNSERIFASGNERAVASLPEWGINDTGYKVRSTDTFAALIEIMNQNMEEKVVYMTMYYDIVHDHPFKDDVKILWFDVRQCGTSDVTPPKGLPQFVLGWNWTSTVEGEVLGAIGHVHDGGLKSTLRVDNELTCDNNVSYATKPEFVQPAGGMAGPHDHARIDHISDISICYGEGLPKKQMKKGQLWNLRAYYDFDQNKGVMNPDGSWDNVMGIEVLFVRQKN